MGKYTWLFVTFLAAAFWDKLTKHASTTWHTGAPDNQNIPQHSHNIQHPGTLQTWFRRGSATYEIKTKPCFNYVNIHAPRHQKIMIKFIQFCSNPSPIDQNPSKLWPGALRKGLLQDVTLLDAQVQHQRRRFSEGRPKLYNLRMQSFRHAAPARCS